MMHYMIEGSPGLVTTIGEFVSDSARAGGRSARATRHGCRYPFF